MNRPRPVLTATGITGGITALAGVLTFLGYAHAATSLSAETQTIVAVAIGAVSLGGHLLAGLRGQGKVTPLADPRDHDGTQLVRADSLAPAVLLPSATGTWATGQAIDLNPASTVPAIVASVSSEPIEVEPMPGVDSPAPPPDQAAVVAAQD